MSIRSLFFGASAAVATLSLSACATFQQAAAPITVASTTATADVAEQLAEFDQSMSSAQVALLYSKAAKKEGVAQYCDINTGKLVPVTSLVGSDTVTSTSDKVAEGPRSEFVLITSKDGSSQTIVSWDNQPASVQIKLNACRRAAGFSPIG